MGQFRIRLAAAAVALIALLGLGSTITDAANFTAPGGYSGEADGYVTCDPTTATLTVSADAQTMTLQGLYGPTPGPFDNGQWMRYRVLYRVHGATDWSIAADWSTWQWIMSRRYLGDASAWIDQSQPLGTTVVPVQSGYGWEAVPQIDFWTGSEYVVTTSPTYTQLLGNGILTQPVNPSFCAM